MAARKPGDEPDRAAELLGRWQAHHAGEPDPHPAPHDPSHDRADDDVRSATESAGSGAGRPTDPLESSARTATPRRARARQAPRVADQNEVAREVVEALGVAAPTGPEPEAPAPRPVRSGPPPVGESTDVVFAPRTLLRRLVGVLVLLSLLATAYAGWRAYDDPTTLTLGVAGTLLVLTLVLYAVRVSASPTRLAIHSGQLEVVRGSSREVFDLTSRFTRFEVVGQPGRRGWKVLLARFGRDPLVIDSSMVDPAGFTAALERHRPR
ncbi:hypothetical protein [Nocardioides litoris]|uniref:hypothetical protein n=1 Tax=Nocardioides litoris TaxID=1926648 RepID=UPI00112353C6|nr:hypothetical protein [Nocardioides litoris]